MMLLVKSPDVLGKKSGCFSKKVGTFLEKGPDVFLFLFFPTVYFLPTRLFFSIQPSVYQLSGDR